MIASRPSTRQTPSVRRIRAAFPAPRLPGRDGRAQVRSPSVGRAAPHDTRTPMRYAVAVYAGRSPSGLEGRVHYFAYGSNMNPAQMAARCPAHRVIGLAALREYQLVFPLYSNEWEGGVGSVQRHHGGTVWGVLFDLSESDLAALDQFEGFRGPGDEHNVFDRTQFTVELVRPDDGSFPRRVRADAYVARPSNPSPPSRRYLDTILEGARHHRLPEEYVARLGATAVQPANP